jgi:hypothetical protein
MCNHGPSFFFPELFTFKKLSRFSQLSETLAKNPLPTQFTQYTHSYNLLKWTFYKKKTYNLTKKNVNVFGVQTTKPMKRAKIRPPQLPEIVFCAKELISGESLDEAKVALAEHGCIFIEQAFHKAAADSMQMALEWAVKTSAEDTCNNDAQYDNRVHLSVKAGFGGQISVKPSNLKTRYTSDCANLDYNPFVAATNTARECLSPEVQTALVHICFGKLHGRLVAPASTCIQSGDFGQPYLQPQRGAGQHQVFALVEHDCRKLCFVPGSHKVMDVRKIDLMCAVAARSACSDSWGTIVIARAKTIRFESAAVPLLPCERLHRAGSPEAEASSATYLRIDVSLRKDTMCAQDCHVLEYLSSVYHLSRSCQSSSDHCRHSVQSPDIVQSVIAELENHKCVKRKRTS